MHLRVLVAIYRKGARLSTKSSLDLNFRFYLTKLPHSTDLALNDTKTESQTNQNRFARESLGKWEHEVFVKSRYKIKN